MGAIFKHSISWITLLSLAGASLFSGCGSNKAEFEHYTGPLSPLGLVVLTSGGLAHSLFPNAEKATLLCNEDLDACERAGGVLLEINPAGKRTLNAAAAMLALRVAAEKKDPQFEAQCEKFAQGLYQEKSDEAYEVLMRLLGFYTVNSSSPLRCVERTLDALQDKRLEHHWVDRDMLELAAYTAVILGGVGVLKARGAIKSTGKLTKLARLGVLSVSAGMLYYGAKNFTLKLKLDHWLKDSTTFYFVGQMGWIRKTQKPSVILAMFRKRFETYLEDATLLDFSTEVLENTKLH
jgi:hypothetical protein